MSHAFALQVIDIQENWNLVAQWKHGGRGSTAGLDKKLEKKES